MNVSKKFAFTFIFLAIAFWVVFGLLRKQANEDKDNFFNKNLRASFIKSDILRRFFHLNFDGDARAIYFNKHSGKIILEVVWIEGVNLDREALNRATESLAKVTGKEIVVQYNNYPIASMEVGSSIEDLEKKYRDMDFSSSQPSIFLLVLPFDTENRTRMGTTLGATSVVLYASAIDELVSHNKTQSGKLQEGTILHEIGHQLGLPHNENIGCLMNAQTEVGFGFGDSDLVSKFCDFELESLSKIKESYQ